MDAAAVTVLSGPDDIVASKEEQRMALRAFPRRKNILVINPTNNKPGAVASWLNWQ